MKRSDRQLANKWVIICHAIICIIIFGAYMAEVVKGDRTITYACFIGALSLLPIIANIVVYKRDSASKAIQYIILVTYLIMYTIVMLTTTKQLPFAYIMPILVVVTIYSDMAYVCTFGGIAFAINVANVIYAAVTTGIAKEDTADIEIRLFATLLVAIFMAFATHVNKTLKNREMEAIEAESEKSKLLAETIMSTSDALIEQVNVTAEKMTVLGDSVMQIKDAMTEVSTGSTETAESVQEQLGQTESIQNFIGDVRETTDSMGQELENTTSLVNEGKDKMRSLAELVEKSSEANNNMISQMQELADLTKNMNTIIETITSIANSTGMLALNASIEAARAGEAGRGFAVVADEISGLANQTKSATVSITDLIVHINTELKQLQEAVEVVNECNTENAKSTEEVQESFAGIANGTDLVNGKAKELGEIVVMLEKANTEIVEKIQTISAITEEVSAHANETCDACDENAALAEEVSGIVREMENIAGKLKVVEENE